ncbi:hypothetical protein [Chryseobacterium sp. MP_3.2]|uniref:hypothetical protein n=1 Tax=Chryseobacterium sp. MP_3.2 TaxID=3071712 RepID=UPI002DFE88AD|nr:hypothetical protein [Chryseobacterium sp. MP_3.2]
MEIKFFSEAKVLDLSGQKISVSERNSKVSDQMFTKYLFPFEIYMDEEFKNTFGDYSSHDAANLPKIITGVLLFENAYRDAKLEILGSEGDYLTGQIDFGFEEIPNFDKPLKELPLERFDVADIHVYAAEICGKKYPQTNFNFPRLYYGKFSPDDTLWDAYNGFINDLNDTGTEMRRNYIDGMGNIFNQNIIHPLPYWLYLLKIGFSDAGFGLAGDILDDPFLAQQCVFSGTEYFSRLTQKRYGLSVNVNDYDFYFVPIAHYNKSILVPKKGKYKIIGYFNFRGIKNSKLARIEINGAEIWSAYITKYEQHNIHFNIDLTTQFDNINVNFKLRRGYSSTTVEPVIKVELIGDELSILEEEGEDNGVITNQNKIDLSRAVPEINFGELVNRTCNLLNYELGLQNKTIIMNKIGRQEPTNVKDFTMFEVLKPQKTFLNKKSFLLRLPNWENEEKPDSVFFDSSGLILNKDPEPATTVIDTNTYAMPVYVAKPQGPNTAVVKSHDTALLQLVKYDGKTGVQNNAKPSPELSFPALFYTNWELYLRGRLRSISYNWTYDYEENQTDTTIKDFIYCYQNAHIITEWVKDYSEGSIQVNITTETVS